MDEVISRTIGQAEIVTVESNEHAFEVNLTAEQKVDLIMRMIQDKWHPKEIKKRIAVSGYIDELEYRLTLNLKYDRMNFGDGPTIIQGGTTNDMFKVHEKFLEEYWKDRKKQRELENDPSISSFELNMTLPYLKKSDVCNSEAELILKSQIKGYI